MRNLRLIALDDGHVIATTHNVSIGGWAWIAETIAQEFACSPDDVHCQEAGFGDVITAAGLPVAQVQASYGAAGEWIAG